MASGLAATSLTAAGGRTAVPWVERYRPTSIEDVLAHQDIINTIKAFIEKKSLPHLLFYGPPGTGKTTTALAIARMIYTRYFAHQVLELNASDERGIDVVRKQIKDFASTRNVYAVAPYKMIILDEADMMTTDAQAALRRVIERFTRNVRFILICNHVHRLIPAIQSRCTRFRFQPLAKHIMLDRLKYIAHEEALVADEPALQAVVRLSHGDMRAAINILQAAALSAAPTIGADGAGSPVGAAKLAAAAAAVVASQPKKDECGKMAVDEKEEGAESPRQHDAAGAMLSEASVYETVGYPTPAEVQSIVEGMMSLQCDAAYEMLSSLSASRGYALADLLVECTSFVSRMDVREDAKAFLYERLSDIEHNCGLGSGEICGGL